MTAWVVDNETFVVEGIYRVHSQSSNRVYVCHIPGWDLTVIQEFLLYRFGKNDQLPKEVKSKLIHLPHIIDTFASHKPDT